MTVGKTHKGLQDAANQVDLELRLKRSGLDLIDAKLDTGKIALGRQQDQTPRTDHLLLQSRTTLPAPACLCWNAWPICATP